jgi:ribosomal protein L44E
VGGLRGRAPIRDCVTPKQLLKYCSCGGNNTANYCGCRKWKAAKAAATNRAQGERGRKYGVFTRLLAPNSASAKPPLEQEKLCPGWNHVVRGGRVFKAQTTPIPTPTSSGTGRRTERQATPAGDQSKPSCPEVSVDSHPSHTNRLTQIHPNAVSLRLRG